MSSPVPPRVPASLGRRPTATPSALLIRLAVALTAGLVVLLAPHTELPWPLGVAAVLWVAGTTAVGMSARTTPGIGVPVALVDTAIVAAAIATTGASHSELRWVLLAAPAVWAFAEQRRLLLLVAAGGLGYLAVALPDVVAAQHHAWQNALTFLAVYGGVAVIAFATAHARHREVLLERELAATQSRMGDELLRRERRQQEDVAVRLHDGPLQLVIAAHQDLEEHLAGEDMDLERTAETIAEAVHALRDLNTDLYEAVLRDAGLTSALREAAAATERNGGPPTTVEVEAEAAGALDGFVVSLVNELLTNVRKHAGARNAAVRVQRMDDGGLLVAVVDDGIGLDLAEARRASRAGHLGLRSVARRVSSAGGTVEIRDLDPGTAVEIRLPRDAELPRESGAVHDDRDADDLRNVPR